ncbi:hypothetical protein Pcinc_020981 [Petrolisthes cinctipes]|uniref:Uncharacterized protein n=1 Tax=Petrolisthes cinctipes TaxID=88211 RepID=A0AAE1KJ18_PETCI|nr:hypothetical protein Pcinc_020981 [Petrolisthes cinctipes]
MAPNKRSDSSSGSSRDRKAVNKRKGDITGLTKKKEHCLRKKKEDSKPQRRNYTDEDLSAAVEDIRILLLSLYLHPSSPHSTFILHSTSQPPPLTLPTPLLRSLYLHPSLYLPASSSHSTYTPPPLTLPPCFSVPPSLLLSLYAFSLLQI